MSTIETVAPIENGLYTVRCYHGSIEGDLDGACWYTVSRSHAALFGQVCKAVLTSAVRPAVIDGAALVGSASGYDADAVLWAHMDEIDAAWAIVTDWEGPGPCIIIREHMYVDAEIVD